MTTWAADEFGGAELGDGRLNRRLIKRAATFADKPTASFHVNHNGDRLAAWQHAI